MRVWNTSLSCARADNDGILDLMHDRLAGIVLSTIPRGLHLTFCIVAKQDRRFQAFDELSRNKMNEVGPNPQIWEHRGL